MEKFFEVKGTTSEKLEKVILKVGVIPVMIVVLITELGNGSDVATASGIAIATIYLTMFFFKSKM